LLDGTTPVTGIDVDSGTIDGTVIGGTTPAAITATTFTSTGIDDNATSTAMTLDSSGNLLVGTTETNPASANEEGVRFSASNSQFSAASTTPVYINRKTSDGTLLDLRKDGTTVGNIGALSSRLYAGTGDTGLFFNDQTDQIQPWNTSTNAARDAAIDLGDDNRRFKNLYLSGGVYLGGTGSANYLDDYEEGTWTPTYNQGVTSPVYDNAAGAYTKIGNLVTFTLRMQLSSGTANTSQVRIAGLPFTSAPPPPGSVTKAQGGAFLNYQSGFKTDLNMSIHIAGSVTELRFYLQSTGASMGGNSASNIKAAMHINGFYYTT
jgi:hypothetical protein